jgi:hypothetical protein
LEKVLTLLHVDLHNRLNENNDDDSAGDGEEMFQFGRGWKRNELVQTQS